eukprot:m.16440 g.16440  ORF g.16440 m.16440 type:complete len:66 (-) comp5699_c0_seq2:23-220(-)
MNKLHLFSIQKKKKKQKKEKRKKKGRSQACNDLHVRGPLYFELQVEAFFHSQSKTPYLFNFQFLQ